jgi:hypothetical protein
MLPFDTNVEAEGDECAWREYFKEKWEFYENYREKCGLMQKVNSSSAIAA